MADSRSRKIITNKEDFNIPERSRPDAFNVPPYIHFNGKDLPTDTPIMPNGGDQPQIIRWTGSGNTEQIDGPGPGYIATVMNGRSVNWRNWGVPANERQQHSIWFKPTADDVRVGSSFNFRILATTRGSGWAGNRSIHTALQDGKLAVRTYDSGGGMTDVVFNYTFQANEWYHLVVDYNWDRPAEMHYYVNGIKIGEQSGHRNLNYDVYHSITVGDMPTGSAGSKSANAFMGAIGEFRWMLEDRWTPSQIWDYYRYCMESDPIDVISEPGAMKLGQSMGQYYPDATWMSESIDLGNPFDDYGRVQLNFEQPAGTYIRLFTRSSDNNNSWSDWIELLSDGTIQSPNRRYLQISVEFGTTDPTVTPKIQEIQVIEYLRKVRLTLTSEPLVVYKDLASGRERFGELANAYDIFITEEVKGEEIIEWKMATNDPMRKRLGIEPVELLARIGDKEFIIRNVLDKRDDSGKKYTEFIGEASWYELRDYKAEPYELIEQDARTHIQTALNKSIIPSDWTIGKIDIGTIKRTLRTTKRTSLLEILREIESLFGGELLFDTVNKTISILRQIGEDNGIRFYHNKNITSIERNIDTYNIVTRLYLEGKNGLTVGSVNEQYPGEPYIENTKWVDALQLRNRIRIGEFSDGRYTIPQNLYDVGVQMLEEQSKPAINYALKVRVLTSLSGHSHEMVGLGDVVYAIEPEILYLTIKNRIMRRKYNVRQPWETEIELSQPKKELADASNRAIDDAIENLVETDPLDVSDVQQMTVFNHLLNSRAEDGTAYWTQSGTGIDIHPEGFSGSASWKITAGYNTEKSLTQSVYGLSHRSAYTISAYMSTEGEITRGASDDAFVGIKVRVHYTEPNDKGATYEDHFLAIPDLTTGGDE